MLGNILKYVISPFLIGMGAGLIVGNPIGAIFLGLAVYVPIFLILDWEDIKTAWENTK